MGLLFGKTATFDLYRTDSHYVGFELYGDELTGSGDFHAFFSVAHIGGYQGQREFLARIQYEFSIKIGYHSVCGTFDDHRGAD